MKYRLAKSFNTDPAWVLHDPFLQRHMEFHSWGDAIMFIQDRATAAQVPVATHWFNGEKRGSCA